MTDGGNGETEIVALSPEFDLIGLGKTEPSLRERIFGAAATAVTERADCPVVIGRDTEALVRPRRQRPSQVTLSVQETRSFPRHCPRR